MPDFEIQTDQNIIQTKSLIEENFTLLRIMPSINWSHLGYVTWHFYYYIFLDMINLAAVIIQLD